MNMNTTRCGDCVWGRPFVLVVLVRGMAARKASAALLSEIARELYFATQRGHLCGDWAHRRA